MPDDTRRGTGGTGTGATGGTGGNTELVAAVRQLGWSASRLVEEVNTVMGDGYVARTTVLGWLNHGRVPREPLPTVVAHVLSAALHRQIPVAELWQGRATPSQVWVPADAGLDVPWHAGGIVMLIRDWLRQGGGPVDRRMFLAISGTALTAPAWQYVDQARGRRVDLAALTGGRQAAQVTHSMVDVVESTIAQLRALDDREGGESENLRFVDRQYAGLADLVRSGRPVDQTVMARLLGAWAQLGQLAGWMAYDAQRHGLAQRYYQTALHAAHAAGDRALGAHVLACMSYQATDRGELKDGVQLADAAMYAAEGAPPAVRSLVTSRYAFAQAAIGSERTFHRAIGEAFDLLDKPGAMANRPAWLYWYDGHNLEAQTGQSLVRLAMTSSRDPQGTVDRASQMLAWRVSRDNDSSPRDSLFQGAWLSRALVHVGDVEAARAVAEGNLDRLKVARSPRILTQFRRLEEDLARLRGADHTPPVAGFRDTLTTALRTTPASA